MAARQHSTNAPDFYRTSRVSAPTRILSEEELLVLLNSRAKIEGTIERLISLLDTLDADVEDLEADFDDDIDEDKERGGDEEPNLGSLDGNFGQGHWSAGGTQDYEHEDRERRILRCVSASVTGGRHV